MKRRNVLVSVLVAGLSLSAPASAGTATQCQYTAQDLTGPAGEHASVNASSPDNRLIVGQAQSGDVIWRDGRPELMAATSPDVDPIPQGVNNNGVVVGTQLVNGGYQAFRYENGVYHRLWTQPDEWSIAVGINETGDIVGHVVKKSNARDRKAVVWRARELRYWLIGQGDSVGISADRKVLTTNAEIFNAVDGSRVSLPGTPGLLLLGNERIFGFQYRDTGSQMLEWDTNGQLIRTYDDGVDPIGVNSHGTLLGTYGPSPSRLGLWRNGAWSDVQADKLPDRTQYADITDDDVIIGHYSNGSSYHAARWFCG